VPSEKALALVIRRIPFSETSLVVTLYSREFGKLGALAKGARRPRSAFAGALDLLSVCRIVLIRKHSDSLDLLTEAELAKGFTPPGSSVKFLHAGYYVAELLQELTEYGDPHPQLFDTALESLRDLEREGNATTIVRRFELTSLRETGHLPVFDACVHCGGSLEGMRAVWFDAAAGGLVCLHCVARGRGLVRIGPGAVEALRLLSDPSNGRWRQLHLPPQMEREVAAVARSAIHQLVGRRLRTEQFLGEAPTWNGTEMPPSPK
jgi:DNA repair protein RecO (recombination protein O)